MRSTNLGRFGTHVIYTYQGRPSATKFWHSWFACRSSYLRLNATVHQLTWRVYHSSDSLSMTWYCLRLWKSQTPSTCWVPSTRKMTVKDGRRRVWSKRFAVFCRFQQTDTRWAEVGVRGSNSRSFVDRTIIQPFDASTIVSSYVSWWLSTIDALPSFAASNKPTYVGRRSVSAVATLDHLLIEP